MRDKLEAAFKEQYALTLEPRDWDALGWPKADRFRRLLDAEAWLDAAMLLVPEGAWFLLKNVMGPQPSCRDLFVADVLFEGGKDRPIRLTTPHDTPAEALLSAILASKETDNG